VAADNIVWLTDCS